MSGDQRVLAFLSHSIRRKKGKESARIRMCLAHSGTHWHTGTQAAYVMGFGSLELFVCLFAHSEISVSRVGFGRHVKDLVITAASKRGIL